MKTTKAQRDRTYAARNEYTTVSMSLAVDLIDDLDEALALLNEAMPLIMSKGDLKYRIAAALANHPAPANGKESK